MTFWLIGYILYQSEFYIQTNDMLKAKSIIEQYEGFSVFVSFEKLEKPRFLHTSWWF